MARVRKTGVDVEQKAGTVLVTIVPFRGADPQRKEETVAVHKFVSDPAYVRISAGVTKSTGDYESLRVDVAVTYPCYPELMHTTIKDVSDYVAERLDAEIAAYLGEDS